MRVLRAAAQGVALADSLGGLGVSNAGDLTGGVIGPPIVSAMDDVWETSSKEAVTREPARQARYLLDSVGPRISAAHRLRHHPDPKRRGRSPVPALVQPAAR